MRIKEDDPFYWLPGHERILMHILEKTKVIEMKEKQMFLKIHNM